MEEVRDRLAGDSGNDIITGGNGADTISGGPGVDAIIILGGNDNITADNFGTLNIADNAIDGVSCGAGADTVYIGPNENDVVDTTAKLLSYDLNLDVSAEIGKSTKPVPDKHVSSSCKSGCEISGSPYIATLLNEDTGCGRSMMMKF